MPLLRHASGKVRLAPRLDRLPAARQAVGVAGRVLQVRARHAVDDAERLQARALLRRHFAPALHRRDLLLDVAALAFLADRGARARWVCSVCTGSLLLGAAGLLRGYRAAGHWGARDALAQFGAEPSNERVCIDRNRLTGGGITAGIDFGIAVAGHWAGDSTGRVIELIMEYAPQPPYGTGRPDLADPQTLAAAHVLLQEAMGTAATADKSDCAP